MIKTFKSNKALRNYIDKQKRTARQLYKEKTKEVSYGK
jgi:hypothetical protein